MLSFGAPVALALLGFMPLVIALYFLRNRPQRITVASNRIWEEVLKRQRQQSILGRFRNSVFLALHLLLILLGTLALAQPSRPGGFMGDTLFIVDTSASMGADDEPGGRLQAARERIRRLAGELDASAKVALVEAGPQPFPRVSPTTERSAFFAALEALAVTDFAGPDPSELAAHLRAGPETPFARTYFFTDNCPSAQLGEIPRLGELRVESVGSRSENVGITGFDVTAGDPGRDLAVSLRNFGPLPSRCRLAIASRGGSVTLTSTELTLGSGAAEVIVFKGIEASSEELAARVSPTGSPDYLAADDEAFVVLGERRRKALLIDSKGSPLDQVVRSRQLGLDVTQLAAADFSRSPPALEGFEVVLSNGFHHPSLDGRPLVLFGPPAGASGRVMKKPVPAFVDTTHPVMRYLSWEDVTLNRAVTLQVPGSRALLSTPDGDLLVAVDTPGARRVVAGFGLWETDLPYRVAFPIFVANAVSWVSEAEGMASAGKRAGDRVRLPAQEPAARVTARGETRRETGEKQGGEAVFDVFRQVGLYTLETDGARASWAVNLFSLAESNIRPAGSSSEASEIEKPLQGKQPIWRWFFWVFVAVLLGEWFLWHRLGG